MNILDTARVLFIKNMFVGMQYTLFSICNFYPIISEYFDPHYVITWKQIVADSSIENDYV